MDTESSEFEHKFDEGEENKQEYIIIFKEY